MYVAVKGGEQAIDNAHRLMAQARRGDEAIADIAPEQIESQLALAVDRVMAEGSLYDRELAENPAAKGSVRLRVQIEAKGDVNSVQLLSQTGNLSAALLRCVAKVVGSRWFLAVGSGATLELPLTLAPDGPHKEP